MAINVSQSFHRTSANAIDDTLTLTKAQMLAINDNLMPSKYLTICQEDGKIYLYDKAATPNVETGKFSVFEGGESSEMPAEDMAEVASPMPSVMSRRFKYSTEEQIVGEWIDGKPIYQKTHIFASPLTIGANGWGNTDLSSIGMAQIVKGIGYDTASDGHLCDSALMFSVNGTGGVVEIYNARNTGMTLNGMTLQYTKTTD